MTGQGRALRDTRNAVPSAYRGVAMSHLDFPLTEQSLIEHFLGLESYRRTRFIVARGPGEDVALLHVSRDDHDSLFAPITAVDILATPAETAYVVDPQADTAIPSSLAAVAVREAPHAKAVIVQGKYEHVSFILNPDPIRLTVLEVVPPRPAKLADQVQRLLDVAEDLAPMVVDVQALDLESLARDNPADSYLLPCRGSDATVPGADVAYLDERPPRAEWLLLGCDRSRQIHEWFYADVPPTVDICPRKVSVVEGGAVLAKCCLLESTIEVDEDKVVVPWGASMAQVKEALALVARAREPEWSAV